MLTPLPERPRPLCPDCGLVKTDRHDCRVPKLIAAIGEPLTTREMDVVRWLAKTDSAEEIVRLFERARGRASTNVGDSQC